MKIYTSYFGNMRNIDDDKICISICRKAPDWYHGWEYKALAPSYDLLMEWKRTKNEEEYVKRFMEEVLYKIDVREVIKSLTSMSNGKDIVLLCYETPDEFCHRHLVAEWLTNNGYFTVEYINQKRG